MKKAGIPAKFPAEFTVPSNRPLARETLQGETQARLTGPGYGSCIASSPGVNRHFIMKKPLAEDIVVESFETVGAFLLRKVAEFLLGIGKTKPEGPRYFTTHEEVWTHIGCGRDKFYKKHRKDPTFPKPNSQNGLYSRAQINKWLDDGESNNSS